MKKNSYQSGLRGEDLAEQFLINAGMKCILRRFRAEDGEIDLIMDDNGILVFVEVKYRPSSNAGMGLASIGRNKKNRLVHAAQSYLAVKQNCPMCRFDVVEITKDGIIHIRDAFHLDDLV